MVQLIKKGGLRERANRSRTYQGSENTEATLNPHLYREQKSASDYHSKNTEKLQNQICTKKMRANTLMLNQ